jgi:hypothetical protein
MQGFVPSRPGLAKARLHLDRIVGLSSPYDETVTRPPPRLIVLTRERGACPDDTP